MARTRSRVLQRNVSPLLADTQRRQPEARSRNARDRRIVVGAHMASVLDEAAVRIALFPEELKIRLLQLLEKGVVLRREPGSLRNLLAVGGGLAGRLQVWKSGCK